MKKRLILLVMFLLPMIASADVVEIDGICYNLISKKGTHVAEVTSNPNYYTGTVIIPESITHDGVNYSVTCIRNLAFAYCTGLTSITISNSVTSIEGLAFWGCTSLTSIAIPNGVTTIGDGAFDSCTGLISVVILNSVMSIGEDAFGFCNLIKDVYCYADNVPSTSTFAFYGTQTGDATLHVPEKSVNTYKAADPWKYFKNIVALTDSDPKTDATGVNVIRNTENNKTAIYDLNGVLMSEPKKGINIVNRKKYVIK